MDVACLPPELHDRPEGIAPAVRANIRGTELELRRHLRRLRRMRHEGA